jgi:transposase
MASKRDHSELEKRRIKAAVLFERGGSAPEVGRLLGVSRQVAHRWKVAWRTAGEAGLASKGKAGRKPKLNGLQTSRILDALMAGPASLGHGSPVWTLRKIAVLIHKMTGVKYHLGHVWWFLVDHGFQCRASEGGLTDHGNPNPLHHQRWERIGKAGEPESIVSPESGANR